MLALALAPAAPAAQPLDGDAGSHRDAGEDELMAVRITRGAHEGHVLAPVDAGDWYAFDVEAGQSAFAVVDEGDVAVRLVEASRGRSEPLAYGLADADATWHVHVWQPAGADGGAYAFRLVIVDRPVQDEAGTGGDLDHACATGTTVHADAHTGFIDLFDSADCVLVPLAANETLRVHALFEETVHGRIVIRPEIGWGGEADSNAYTATAPEVVRLTVLRSYAQPLYAAGTYAVTLTREGGDGPRAVPAPVLEPVPGFGRAFALAPAPNGGMVVGHEDGVDLVHADGSRTVLAAGFTASAVAVDAEGDVLAFDGSRRQIVHVTPDGDARPFFRTSRSHSVQMAFAPDGGLVIADGNDFHVLNAEGRVTRVVEDVTFPHALAFGPDGALYATDWSRGRILRVDLDANRTDVALDVPACGWTGGLAFDAAGRAVVLGGHCKAVIASRLDAEAWTVVARGVQNTRALAIADGALYAIGDLSSYWSTRLVRAPFEGGALPPFTGAFTPPRVGDLVITSAHDERVVVAETEHAEVHGDAGASRTILVDVTNTGEGTFTGIVHVVTSYYENHWRPAGSATVALDLAPGETRAVSMEWETSGRVGARSMRSQIRVLEGVETDELNNGHEWQTGVGTDAAGAYAGLLYAGSSAPVVERILGWE